MYKYEVAETESIEQVQVCGGGKYIIIISLRWSRKFITSTCSRWKILHHEHTFEEVESVLYA